MHALEKLIRDWRLAGERAVIVGGELGLPVGNGARWLAGEHQKREVPFGKADLVAVAKSRWPCDLPAVHGGPVLGRHVVNLDGQITVNHDRAVPARYRRIIDYHIVVGEPADAVQPDLESYLPAAIEKPTMGAGRFDGNFAGRESLQFACFGTEWNSNFTSDGMSAGRVFDTAASGTKRLTPRVAFEMYAQ
jgi:hypothetical protein